MNALFKPNYQFNTDTLEFEKVIPYRLIAVSIALFISVVSIVGFASTESIVTQSEKELIIKKEQDQFSRELLIQEIEKYKFKYPHIVLAQAMEESHHFKSDIFKENHNLFGMKAATIRINVAVDTNRGHAVFSNWRDSVLDRALFDAAYMKGLTESEYFTYLENYAENPAYIKNLKRHIEISNLKQIF